MKTMFTRRGAIRLLPAAGLAAYSTAGLGQGLDIVVGKGGAFKPVNVAVTNFGGDSQLGALVTSVIANNFRRSVFIVPVDAKSFIEKQTNPEAPAFDEWKMVNAQFVVAGRSARGADGRVKTEFRLWDVSTGQQVAGQQYVTDAGEVRRVSHIISDAVFSRVTGEKGWFDSRVAFISESGPKERRVKRLAVMDQDGANVRNLTSGDDLILTPRFSPNSQELTYMSFGRSDPQVYLLNVESRQSEVVGKFPGMSFSPRFSPDGQRLVMSISQGSATNIFSMDLRSRAPTRLTDTQAIDTSPSYSPDGQRIVFESDRGGTQQIYVMGAGGGGAQRLSHGEGARYSTPVWSPKGDYIAFTRQKGGSFGIGVMKPDGSGERILTEGFHNEGPTWAPNGLYVMFFREPQGSGGPKLFMADVFGRAEFPVPTPTFASDPAWSPLLG
jgi:TolB protein